MIHFKYGFFYKDFLYGWHEKELYRLPLESGKRHYPLKKLTTIDVGKQKGYRCKRDKLSMLRLKDMSIVIDKKISVIKDKDFPF